MVRVKYRYILAEIITEKHSKSLKLPLKEFDLTKTILNVVEDMHGDYGLACVQAGFSIKMYNPATRIFIARVRRKFHSILCTSLPLVTAVGKLKIAIRTLSLTGTIRSALKFLVDYDKEKLIELMHMHQLSPEVKDEIASLIAKCYKRLERRKFDTD